MLLKELTLLALGEREKDDDDDDRLCDRDLERDKERDRDGECERLLPLELPLQLLRFGRLGEGRSFLRPRSDCGVDLGGAPPVDCDAGIFLFSGLACSLGLTVTALLGASLDLESSNFFSAF